MFFHLHIYNQLWKIEFFIFPRWVCGCNRIVCSVSLGSAQTLFSKAGVCFSKSLLRVNDSQTYKIIDFTVSVTVKPGALILSLVLALVLPAPTSVLQIKICSYVAWYPFHRTAQSASNTLHSLAEDLFIPTPTRLLWEAFIHATMNVQRPLTRIVSPLSFARHSFMQLSEPGRRGVNENAQASKWQQLGFEHGLPWVRVCHSM